jgi:hypothetical protein
MKSKLRWSGVVAAMMNLLDSIQANYSAVQTTRSKTVNHTNDLPFHKFYKLSDLYSQTTVELHHMHAELTEIQVHVLASLKIKIK